MWYVKKSESFVLMDSFIKHFDPSNSEHVLWFKTMIKAAGDYQAYNLMDEVNKNPMKLKLEKTLDWPQTHSMLGMKYARGVLEGTAWIPKAKEH